MDFSRFIMDFSLLIYHGLIYHCLRLSLLTINFPTNTMDFRGLDSGVISSTRGGTPGPTGNWPQSLSQAILVGVMLVGKLSALGVHFVFFRERACLVTYEPGCAHPWGDSRCQPFCHSDFTYGAFVYLALFWRTVHFSAPLCAPLCALITCGLFVWMIQAK